MRISDWSSDVCSSDLIRPSTWPLGLGFLESWWKWVPAFCCALVTGRMMQVSLSEFAARMMMPGCSLTNSGTYASCGRSEEHTSELQSLMRISYAVFCLKKKKKINTEVIKYLSVHSITQDR